MSTNYLQMSSDERKTRISALGLGLYKRIVPIRFVCVESYLLNETVSLLCVCNLLVSGISKLIENVCRYKLSVLVRERNSLRDVFPLLVAVKNSVNTLFALIF